VGARGGVGGGGAGLAGGTATTAAASGRKYYRREFGDRLRRLFERDEGAKVRQRPPRMANSGRRMAGGGTAARRSLSAVRPLAGGRYLPASAQLSPSPVHPGHPAAPAPRRAPI